ncbi:uncharacterized protein LOC142336381 isoform X2 [Convolutriloba macropyga]|uniref:uncharacterized protein LOC142336381 isoform X2 n=1 Tax=Convolutriloba macropyga TaxID=536237 RepID=UPI003F524288
MAQKGYGDIQYGSARRARPPGPKATAANTIPLGQRASRAPPPQSMAGGSGFGGRPMLPPQAGGSAAVMMMGGGQNRALAPQVMHGTGVRSAAGIPRQPLQQRPLAPNMFSAMSVNNQVQHQQAFLGQGRAMSGYGVATAAGRGGIGAGGYNAGTPRPMTRQLAEPNMGGNAGLFAGQAAYGSKMAPSGGVKQPAAGVHNPQSMGGGLYGSGGSMGILEAQAARFQAPGLSGQQHSSFGGPSSAISLELPSSSLSGREPEILTYGGRAGDNFAQQQQTSYPQNAVIPPTSAKKATNACDIIDIEKYSKLVGWDRMTRAPDDVVIGLLNAIYDNVSEMSTLTSEKRIFELVRLLKEYLNLLLVPTWEFQKYFEQYLKRLVKDQGWISITVSQALCISVTAPDDDNSSVNRKFFCHYCTLSYSSSLFTCNLCQSSFKHIADLEAHEYQAHGIANKALFVCDICSQSFPHSPMQLRDHIYEKHICSRKHMECPYGCEKLILVMSEFSYNDHIKSMHQCSKCKNLVQGPMEIHEQMFHNEQRAGSRPLGSPEESPKRSEKHARGSSSRRHEYSNRDKHESPGTRGRSSPPPRRARSPGPSHLPAHNDYGSIMDADIAKAQETLREMQRAKEMLERSEGMSSGEYFHYEEPVSKAKWPQCKMCKLQQPPGGFKCGKCSQVFPYRVHLFKHMKDVHKMKMPRSFECEMCAKVFSDLTILHYHVTKESHACSYEHLQCSYGCMSLFQNRHSLDVHTNAKHEFMCHICEAPIVNQTKKRHFAMYHPGEKFIAATETINSEESKLDNARASSSFRSHGPQTITLAPRILNNMRQSVLNLAPNRQELFLTIPPQMLSEKAYASKTKTQLINMGYMYCKDCELVYHPALPTCKRCNNVPFLNNVSLREHQSEVHQHHDSSGLKECPVVSCGGKFSTYVQLINHQVEHFCREHTECPFGCKQLLPGGDGELVRHCRSQHPNKDIPSLKTVNNVDIEEVVSTDSFVNLSKLQEKLVQKRSAEMDQSMDIEVTLKCIDCGFTCSEESIRICEHCQPESAFQCADGDELRGHLSDFHKLFIKGEFPCEICSSKRQQPVTFPNDPSKYLEHRRKVHGTCIAHRRCPNIPCLVLFEPESVAGTKHTRFLCQYMKEPPQPDVTNGEGWKNPGWKMCLKCRFTAEVAKIFVCENCEDPKPFFFKDEYYAHLVLTHSYKAEYTFACFVCKSTFGSNAKAWLSHRETSHKICDQHLVCSQVDCVWMAPNRSEIEAHLQKNNCIEHEIKGIVEDTKICHVCSQIFSDGVIYQCVMCSRTKQQFMSLLEYLVHLENIHAQKIKGNFDCLDCSAFSAKSPYALSRHNHSEHKKCQSHKFCPNSMKCSVVFPQESVNMDHQCLYAIESPLKTIESPPKRRVGDSMSSFKAPEPTIIRAPVIPKKKREVIDISADGVELKCDDCGFQVEKEEDAMTCTICHREFLTKAELCSHMRLDHQSIVRGSFECNICVPKKVFEAEPTKLLDHYEKDHKFCRHHKKCPGCAVLLPSQFKSTHCKKCSGKHKNAPEPRESRGPDSRKFFEAIGAVPKAEKKQVVVRNLDTPKPLIEDADRCKRKEKERKVAPQPEKERTLGSSGSSSRLGALHPKVIREPLPAETGPSKEPETLKLPDKYKIAKSGKTKLFCCKTCNYASMVPPPGRFKGDMKCKQRNCALIFHQKYELVAHLELAHSKPLPPIKNKIMCEFCRDAKVKNPFAHNASVPLCEHKKLEHGCCRTHIVCPVEKCSMMFPTRDALEQHLKEKNCETLYVAEGNQDERKDEDLGVWSKHAESVSMWKKRKSDNSEQSLLTCQSCDLKAEANGSDVGNFVCESCAIAGKKLTFAFKFELLAHLLRDHSKQRDTQLRFKCELCPEKEVPAVSHVAHRKTKHNYCTVHYRCSKIVCNKLFSTENDLNKHESNCLLKSTIDKKGEKAKLLIDKYGSKVAHKFQLYECTVCLRKFGCMTIYKCNQCPDSVSSSSKSFVNLVEFFAHLKEGHDIDTDVEHLCALCDKFRANAYEMQRHVREVHKVCGHHFLCPKMCKYLFNNKEKLLEHYQTGNCENPESSSPKNEKKQQNTPGKRKLTKVSSSNSSDTSTAKKRESNDNGAVKPKWEDMMANMLKYTNELLSDEEQPTKPKVVKIDDPSDDEISQKDVSKSHDGDVQGQTESEPSKDAVVEDHNAEDEIHSDYEAEVSEDKQLEEDVNEEKRRTGHPEKSSSVVLDEVQLIADEAMDHAYDELADADEELKVVENGDDTEEDDIQNNGYVDGYDNQDELFKEPELETANGDEQQSDGDVIALYGDEEGASKDLKAQEKLGKEDDLEPEEQEENINDVLELDTLVEDDSFTVEFA